MNNHLKKLKKYVIILNPKNLFLDWFQDRKRIVVNFYIYIKSICLKMKLFFFKINKIRKQKKYSKKYLKYNAYMKFYILPKFRAESFIKKKAVDFRLKFLYNWMDMYTEFKEFEKEIRAKVKKKFRHFDDSKKKKIESKRTFIKFWYFNYWYSNLYYHILFYFILSCLSVLSIFILYVILKDTEIFY